MPLDQASTEEKEMSFLDHLEELRWHLIRSFAAVVVFTIGAFISAKWIFQNIVFAPARTDFPTFKFLCKLGDFLHYEGLCITDIPFKVQSRNMTGQFSMHVMSSFIIGFIVSFPYVAWELWRFVKPGLQVKERKYSRGAVAAISFLFFLGVMFGYYIIAPWMVYFLANYSISDMVVNEFDITSYVSTVVMLVFGAGLLFQLPVVIYFLTKVGIVTPKFLREYRKHSIVVILIVAAILTPPDPLSQGLISIPLYLLFEISILISAFVAKGMAKEEAEELRREEAEKLP
ncbi:MAG: twin-arginine translocase subunit TatC [Cyclobacteriaceae bacterium]|jgi:sec-independent protein translocase protein TatC|nr:twin-arginine translocase subunit TatC [Cyclobacteriaceae bacterium]MDH4294870.1 twin-arginine translocase subunit TatC [Cyclobacteriaceae bacterium]MDH5247372.1 twin-arginine translocase subunit TatC [Cyclobacteriaceae bacterium]